MSDFRLKVFQSVAKNLSFTKASQELFVSQPAITKHIQELEATYQTRLFDRQGSKISLTESGRLLLEHCERILEDYKRLEYEMHLLHNEYSGVHPVLGNPCSSCSTNQPKRCCSSKFLTYTRKCV